MAVAVAFQATASYSFSSETSHTYSSVAIGTAASDRLVLVGVVHNAGAYISGLTVGGNAATLAAQATNSGQRVEWYWILVASGTTANIVVTYGSSTSTTYTRLFVYSLTGADTTSPVSGSNSTTTVTSGALTTSVDVGANGGALALSAVSGRGVSSVTWSGASEDSDQGTTGSAASYTTASVQTGHSVVCTANATGGTGVLLVIAIQAGGNAYSLSMGAGALALTGQAAGLKAGRVTAAASGAFGLSGQPAGLLRSVIQPAGTGVYSLGGQAAGLHHGWRLAADAATFALTGQDAGLSRTARLGMEAGAHVLTGVAAALLFGRQIAAAAGEYLLDGQSADLTVTAGDRTLDAGGGSYGLSGQDVGLLYDRIVLLGAGAHALSGGAVGLAFGRRIAADAGSYALSGEASAFSRDLRLAGAAGAYLLAGQDAMLERARLMAMGAGAYALAAQMAGLYLGHRLAMAAGAHELTGIDVAFALGHAMPAGVGAYALTGNGVALRFDKLSAGAYVLAGQAANFSVVLSIPLSVIVQRAELDDYIVLYQLDATMLGGDVYRFTSSAYEDAEVAWNGNLYGPVPVETEGWEYNGRGPLPTPILRVSNVSLAFGAAAIAFGDLLGAELTRIRTFRRFLDGEADADPTQYFPLDIYRIDRKRLHSKAAIEWELAAVLDQQGLYLPRRPILRNACTHVYRTWTGSAFDSTHATCPYAGSAYFTEAGASTSRADLDRCGKRLSDCKKRFGTAPLPTRAFPGVARTPSLN